MSSYDVGDIATIGITFTNTAGTAVDPTTVTLTFRAPNGTETVWVYGVNAHPTKTGTGVYSADIPITLAGTWVYRWVGAGSNQAAESGSFYAEGSPFDAATSVCCTIAQIDALLNRGGESPAYSSAAKLAARDAATTAFEQAARCSFRVATRTDTLDGPGGLDLLLPVPRVLTVTSATVDGTAVTVGDIDVLTPQGSLYLASGWGSSRRGVVVTYTHGYTTTPDDVSRAIAMLAASILKDGPFDDRGYGVTDDGGFVRLLTAGVSGASFSIPDVQAALMRYRYPSIA